MSGILKALEAALPAEALAVPVSGPWTVWGVEPEAVAAPASVEEVRAVLAAASGSGVGVVPLGGGTDVGAEPPSRPFMVLSTARLDGIEEYSPADLTVTARAGTSLEALGKALAEEGQWLPVDPPFAPRRTMGGLVATGSAGALGMAYGTPRDHVLGLTVVTGDGRVLRLGGRVMKNVAGFDLVKLMVGSHGTLGVVVSACMRLFPRPPEDRVLVLTGDGPTSLLGAARRVATAPVVPASAVLVSPSPLGAAAASALVVRVHGAPASVEVDARRLLDGAGDAVSVVRGGNAVRVLEAVRDHSAGHGLVLRAAALPGLLPEVLAALNGAVPVSAFTADVMVGRVRAGVAGEVEVDAARLLTLRSRLEEMGGSLVVERATPALLAQVPAYGALGRAGGLGTALRARFDPEGILSPGRFGS